MRLGAWLGGAAVKERPILMSAPMVRAILAGTKTQTRRVVNPQPEDGCALPREWSKVMRRRKEPDIYGGDGLEMSNVKMADGSYGTLRCRYGTPGDRLWVREAWAVRHEYDGHKPAHIPALARGHYAATEDRGGLMWRPSIHMPRWASRITLVVTGVRVERLQEISEADSLAEGIVSRRIGTGDARTGCREAFGLDCDNNAWAVDARQAYSALWESINGPGSWDANPWVWVVEFRRQAA